MLLYRVAVKNHTQNPKNGKSDFERNKKCYKYPFAYDFYVKKR